MNRGWRRERSQGGAVRLDVRWHNAVAAPPPPRERAPRGRSVPEARPGASEFPSGPPRASAVSQSAAAQMEKKIGDGLPQAVEEKTRMSSGTRACRLQSYAVF